MLWARYFYMSSCGVVRSLRHQCMRSYALTNQSIEASPMETLIRLRALLGVSPKFGMLQDDHTAGRWQQQSDRSPMWRLWEFFNRFWLLGHAKRTLNLLPMFWATTQPKSGCQEYLHPPENGLGLQMPVLDRSPVWWLWGSFERFRPLVCLREPWAHW